MHATLAVTRAAVRGHGATQRDSTPEIPATNTRSGPLRLFTREIIVCNYDAQQPPPGDAGETITRENYRLHLCRAAASGGEGFFRE
jgi:hypothetical protein